MRKAKMKCALISAATVGFFALTASAYAFGLSDGDYVYLQTQHVERYNAPILDLSPLEQTRLHSVINDPRMANDPSSRDDAVRDVLAEFLSHQLWEKAHPGKLWDAPSEPVRRP